MPSPAMKAASYDDSSIDPFVLNTLSDTGRLFTKVELFFAGLGLVLFCLALLCSRSYELWYGPLDRDEEADKAKTFTFMGRQRVVSKGLVVSELNSRETMVRFVFVLLLFCWSVMLWKLTSKSRLVSIIIGALVWISVLRCIWRVTAFGLNSPVTS